MLHFFIINKSRLGNHVMVLLELLYCNAPKTTLYCSALRWRGRTHEWTQWHCNFQLSSHVPALLSGSWKRRGQNLWVYIHFSLLYDTFTNPSHPLSLQLSHNVSLSRRKWTWEFLKIFSDFLFSVQLCSGTEKKMQEHAGNISTRALEHPLKKWIYDDYAGVTCMHARATTSKSSAHTHSCCHIHSNELKNFPHIASHITSFTGDRMENNINIHHVATSKLDVVSCRLIIRNLIFSLERETEVHRKWHR